MAIGATSLSVSGQPLGSARVVKIDEGKDLEALDRAKRDGADHVFFAMKGDIYVATAKSLELEQVKTGEPIEFGSQKAKILFGVNAPNSRQELWDTEVPKIARRGNMSAGIGWAAMFGGMGAMLGWMAGRSGAAAVRGMVIGGLGLPAILVGIPMAALTYFGYKELKAKANPATDALDGFGKVVD